jgi:CHAD domain-containing protein
MGYVFRARERIDSGLRRVVREQVRGAIHDLRDPRGDRHEGVHEARKRFKMIRATLRLARPTLGELVYRLENAWYRDTGKRLSSVRDAVAMIESLEGLRRRFAKEMPPEMGDAVRRGLDGRLRGVSEDGRALARRCREVAEALEGALARAKDWPLEDRGFRAIGKGLKRTYRQGRLLMEKALAEPSDVNLHEWRKRAKDHWYHVRLLRNLWPRVLDAYRWEMKALSEALGDDHDLALLGPVVQQEPESFGGFEAVERFTEFLGIRRRELQDQARLLGRRIYAEKPRLLVARFESRW